MSYLLHTLSCKLLGARDFPTWSHLCPQCLQCLIKRLSERKNYMKEMISGPFWDSAAQERSLDLQGLTCHISHVSLSPSAKLLLPALDPTGHSTQRSCGDHLHPTGCVTSAWLSCPLSKFPQPRILWSLRPSLSLFVSPGLPSSGTRRTSPEMTVTTQPPSPPLEHSGISHPKRLVTGDKDSGYKST